MTLEEDLKLIVKNYTDDLREIIALEKKLVEVTRWFPIDTAPKNTRFLVYFPEAGGQIKTWYQGSHDAEIATTWEDGRTLMRATHWRPLPPPPTRPVCDQPPV